MSRLRLCGRSGRKALSDDRRYIVVQEPHKENEKDLEEIDQTVRAALRFVTAETVDAVFAHALALPKKEAAVEHLTAIAGMERQEVRCGDQL